MKAMNARFLIGCLALAAMVIMVAPSQASAAGPGVAFQASSLPLQARGEGLTETIGAVVLQATAPGTVPSGSSVTIVYSGSIANTSAFGTTATAAAYTAGLSCSISSASTPALVNDGCGTNIGAGNVYFSTTASGSQLTVQFNTVVTFNAGDYLEVSQVRMNVNALGSATTTVTATLSGTSATPITNPITFTQSVVGVSSIVNPSVKGTVTTAAAALQTCNVATNDSFVIKVNELYPAALTSATDESNFSSLGTIANGSLVSITFNNIPTGFGVQMTGEASSGASTIVFTPTSASAGGSGGSYSNTAVSGAPVNISTGSAITYIFAVTGDSTSLIDATFLTFAVGYTNGKSTPALSGTTAPALGTVVTATATVSLAPGSGTVSFATNNEGGGTIVTIGDCVTNLLFPFTTNQVGFDTSIQISNTSSDKLAFPSGGATQQSGTCTLTYYPTDLTTQTASAVGVAGTPSQFTTPTIPSGGAWATLQSASTFKGQSGYMFAVCRFLDAHAFTYVFNGTQATATISQGLLGLVIPSSEFLTAGSRLTFSSYETLSH